jgi:hypothetical protein
MLAALAAGGLAICVERRFLVRTCREMQVREADHP